MTTETDWTKMEKVLVLSTPLTASSNPMNVHLIYTTQSCSCSLIWCNFPILEHTAHLWFISAGAHKKLFFCCCKMMVWIFISVQTTSCPWRFFSWVWKSCKDEISHFHFTNIWCWLLGFLLAWSWISSRVWNPIFSPEYETSSIWSLLFIPLSLSLSTWS